MSESVTAIQRRALHCAWQKLERALRWEERERRCLRRLRLEQLIASSYAINQAQLRYDRLRQRIPLDKI